MTKSELIEILVGKQAQLGYRDVELAVKTMLEQMGQTLASGQRIEIRGFGSFSLHYRPPRVGRNPKSGDPVSLPAKYVPHFKPGFAVIANRISWASRQRFFRERYLFRSLRLPSSNGVTAFIKTLEEVRRGVAAEVTVNASVVHIVCAGDVLRRL